jgi:RNA polymerase sigma-70 factor (ECF subfamily)
MTDRQIIELFLQRDECGIAELERQYGARLTRIAEGFLSREDSEECVNDTWLAAWNHIPPDEPRDLFAYLAVILRNMALNRLMAEQAEKRSAEVVELSEELAACIPDPKADTEGEALFSLSDVLNHFLQTESPEKRKMFVLRFWYGKSFREIAERFGCSEAKVQKALNRMKHRLKKALARN